MRTAYEEKTVNSFQYHEEAKKVIPGGVNANIKFFAPYPITMKSAAGAYLYDIDENRYIDYNLCYGALVLGHGHQKVIQAVEKQLSEMGTMVLGTPHQLELTIARELVDLYPGIESVRFTNSGLEATLLAIRLAFAWTGRKKIAKFEGHYHGGYDQVLISVQPTLRDQGELPRVQSDSLGLPDYYVENTIVLPFNDLEQTEAILRKHHQELAAVILEPVQAGYIPPEPAFLKGLRELTEHYGIVLIFDEVKTGFRISLAGAQGKYGVKPDLTALGKVLGGGFPVGAVGGKKEILSLCASKDDKNILVADHDSSPSQPNTLFHSGTYNGHPTVLAAGLATIQELKNPSTFQKLESHTIQLRKGVEEIFQHYGIEGTTVGDGSIFNIVLTKNEVRNIQDVLRSDLSLRKQLDYLLLSEGIYVKPLNRFSVSTAHDLSVIHETLNLFEQGVKKWIR
ncbi:aspartate aminotransferase family protein [Thermoflavimicrobium dichotomicum]|uniref:Glutamate-1-semialdehyde 2,1-aminomutase n=1 Tax=Thermoflavimicrobium dichotomicum TaxID=46223 RepID=A0A1I3P498_9BACL|nr:aspartate aminotransferase family protein [Thermoflavimicrobium dichotomicum]SFJ16232.1 glutamate-1-semialdehyde 2,1-aminomutase [Thermoflavimicrobium dichotomicum]